MRDLGNDETDPCRRRIDRRRRLGGPPDGTSFAAPPRRRDAFNTWEGHRIDELPLIPFAALAEQAAGSGPIWGHESADLDITLLSWRAGAEIAAHVNDDVDVLLIGVAGTGDVSVGDETIRLEPGRALLIPKGAARSFRCGSARWSYLSVHRRRRGLWPTVGSPGTV